MTNLDTIDLQLRQAGLRPTRQRRALARMLFGTGGRHVTAEMLHAEAAAAAIGVSLATVYNTLNQFCAAGLLREVAFEGDCTCFDTNTSDHVHFYLEGENRLIDIDASQLAVSGLPDPPPGTAIDRIDVIVRLKRQD